MKHVKGTGIGIAYLDIISRHSPYRLNNFVPNLMLFSNFHSDRSTSTYINRINIDSTISVCFALYLYICFSKGIFRTAKVN